MRHYARVQARSSSLQLGNVSRTLVTPVQRHSIWTHTRSLQARMAPCRQLRTLASPGIAAESDQPMEAPLDAGDSGNRDDVEEEVPPLPASALELLSQLLTGLPASGSTSATPRPQGATASAAAAGAYTPRVFCVNCCRPLPPPPPQPSAGASARCSGCGHDSSRDAEVLGDPHAWVEAYELQLRQQEAAEADEQQGPQSSGSGVGSSGGGRGEVLLAADARMILHRSSLPPYPGRPERLQAIMSRLHSRGLLPRCRLLPCRPASDEELLAVHSPQLVHAIRSLGGSSPNSSVDSGDSSSGSDAAEAATASSVSEPFSTSAQLASDTLYNAHTGAAALLAAGAAAEVGAALAGGRAARALAVVRPPGAQAGVGIARGGCYLNNVAVAAAAALAAGAQRVLIVDWDVHHGRGTQEIFAEDPRVMVLSMHRHGDEIYPGTGASDEVGEGEGEGTTLNLAFTSPEGSSSPEGGGRTVSRPSAPTDGDLLSAALHVVLPVGLQFRPQVVLVAAGFGALKGDPVGGCGCSPAVFAHLTHLLAALAPATGGYGGLGLLLEGGYNLSGTAEAVEGCLRVLLGEAPPPLPGPWATTSAGWLGIMNAMQVHSRFWSALYPLSFNGWVGTINEQKERQRQRQLEAARREEQEREALLQLQLEQLAQLQGGRRAGSASASYSAYSGAAGGSWEADYDDDVNNVDHEDGDAAIGERYLDSYDDVDAYGDGGAANSFGLEQLAEMVQQYNRTSAAGPAAAAAAAAGDRDGWEAGGGGDGVEHVRGDDQEAGFESTGGSFAVEGEDPRAPGDIDPAELLDVFFGTGADGSDDGSDSAAYTEGGDGGGGDDGGQDE